MAKDGVMIIDDTAIEKFGYMENASEVRISGGKINIKRCVTRMCLFASDNNTDS